MCGATTPVLLMWSQFSFLLRWCGIVDLVGAKVAELVDAPDLGSGVFAA